MKRTTVFLPDDLHENLEEAFRARTSMAELIRSRLARTHGRAKRRAGADLSPTWPVLWSCRNCAFATFSPLTLTSPKSISVSALCL